MAIEEVLEHFRHLLESQEPPQRLIYHLDDFRPDEGEVKLGVEVKQGNHWVEDDRWARNVLYAEVFEGLKLLERQYVESLVNGQL
jgi:hypothetical protein